MQSQWSLAILRKIENSVFRCEKFAHRENSPKLFLCPTYRLLCTLQTISFTINSAEYMVVKGGNCMCTGVHTRRIYAHSHDIISCNRSWNFFKPPHKRERGKNFGSRKTYSVRRDPECPRAEYSRLQARFEEKKNKKEGEGEGKKRKCFEDREKNRYRVSFSANGEKRGPLISKRNYGSEKYQQLPRIALTPDRYSRKRWQCSDAVLSLTPAAASCR